MRKREAIPELRAPEDWEHNIVARILIEQYRKEIKPARNWTTVVGIILLAISVLEFITDTGLVGSSVLLCLLSVICFYMTNTANEHSKMMKRVVQRMEQKEYTVAVGWASNIRPIGLFYGGDDYGVAQVQLESGRDLEEEYTLPYRYAVEICKKKETEPQRVLLVFIPYLSMNGTHTLVPIDWEG